MGKLSVTIYDNEMVAVHDGARQVLQIYVSEIEAVVECLEEASDRLIEQVGAVVSSKGDGDK